MLVMEEGMMDSVDLMLRCQKGAREHIMVEWTVELVLWQYSPNMVKQTQVRLVRDPLLASQVEPGGKLIKT